ncbi:MAG: division/cell wall cluster transcriptional repressor MraZ [Rhodospirillales bacterium]|nr:division/cell wall cluster transcriptional repressor MraZ [Alphaproteobacteria bacterium]MCB9986978.1 division/cell wall cluster transcriptional repressor MraZ [Rhodospirillales bacterium]USO08248.1 MAG: division/cell wall cluster transcriptional repressor MraZ [Rhodospirillales bacterium]
MSLFLSTFVNRIDAKGRVSVPGAFRAALADRAAPGVSAGVVLMRSPVHAALEGFAPAMMDEIAARLDQFPLFSPEQDHLAAATFGECVALGFDAQGRIGLPAELAAHAQITDTVAFVGMGRKFQMWNPQRWSGQRDAASKAVKAQGLTLPKVP